MIIGTGTDVVNIDRFAELLEGTPALRERLFVLGERELPVRSLAARFAAKEAAAKALRAPAGLNWQDCWVEKDADGAPYLVVEGTVARRAAELGINRWHLTMSHDEPIATATVIAEHLSDSDLLTLLRLDPSARGVTVSLPGRRGELEWLVPKN
ncbi:holo-ACP synthase [Rothia nasimurium]|uniref:Holo-[acyl-carrier-protein] synthase n=1 Tax=Rothia nasimurium TaxID=85336 RepID=A0A4Y9F3Y9_9MICC|nr:holo-ACP synthase [Rothia nasimurium]MBF0808575.1 holo-ACP synthase [Rothia nasimurium]TFU21762.1 holo-ACP synthase [Rothia nasimurium]